VVLADDMPEVLHDLRQLLVLAGGLEILGMAANGQEAIWMAEAYRPDVVVMDLEMPVLDGYEATRQIKERKLAGRVVVLSIYAGLEEQRRAYSSGADAFIAKGAAVDSLLNAIFGRNDAPFEITKGVSG
jgi:NarL family two-component system response regulator LiaR